MSAEPERPIEQSLREYAEKRRHEAGDPTSMHPATRQMLHGEVARVYQRRGKQRASSWWGGGVWPKLAWAGAVAVVFAGAIYLFGPWAGREQQAVGPLALNRKTPEPESLPSARPIQPRPESRTEPAVTVAPSPSVETAALDRALAPELKSTAPPPAPVVSQPAPREDDQAARLRFMRRYGLAPTPAAPAPSPTEARNEFEESLAKARSETNGLATFAERQPSLGVSLTAATGELAFSNGASSNIAYLAQNSALANQTGLRLLYSNQAQPVTVRKVGSQQAGLITPVLASFHVEQEGNELRVEDKDGSIYVGNLQPVSIATTATAPMRARSSRPQDQAAVRAGSADADAAATQSQAFSFQVVGTNRTLRQKVVFQGTLVDLPQPAAFQAGATLEPEKRAPGQQATLLQQRVLQNHQYFRNQQPGLQNNVLLNRRISGKAVVGGSQEIRVEAVPATP